MVTPSRRSPLRPLRILLVLVAALAVLTVVSLGVLTGLAWSRGAVDTAGKVDFVNQLKIPPLAESRTDAAGRRVFDLTAQPGETEFFPGVATGTWGVNGSYLGPTLRAERGQHVLVNVRNMLGEPTTVHWHGMHLPAHMDGGPHQLIKPGSSWSPQWRIDQPAATLWYHPHLHGATEDHVYRGLAGMFILDDPAAKGLPLPNVYGVDDLPVIVQDKRFTRGRQFDDADPLFSPTGILGTQILVNGTQAPYQSVTTERIRLRLLNASTARIYSFGLSDDRPFVLIGTDGGLLPAPLQTQRVQLSPGERAEIVVSMRPGDRSVLRSYPPELGTDFWNERFGGGDDTLDVLELRAAEHLQPSPPVPDKLVQTPRLAEASAAMTRQFDLSGHAINGKSMQMGRIDATVTKGTTEVWEVTNSSGTPHNFHVHDVRFQVLDVDGAQPPPHLSGWKDTLYLTPNRKFRIIASFSDYADPDNPYMFHCHVLRHEDRGMMGQFVVVDPGQRAGSPPVHADDPRQSAHDTRPHHH